MEAIKYNDKFYVVNRSPFEPRERFIKRAWYAIKIMELFDISYEDAIKISIIWANVKYLGCEYLPEIMDKLALYEKK